jgi:hypothetical protein
VLLQQQFRSPGQAFRPTITISKKHVYATPIANVLRDTFSISQIVVPFNTRRENTAEEELHQSVPGKVKMKSYPQHSDKVTESIPPTGERKQAKIC